MTPTVFIHILSLPFHLSLPPPFSTFVPFPLHLSLSTLSVSYTIGWGSSLLLYCCDKRQDQKQLTEGSQSRTSRLDGTWSRNHGGTLVYCLVCPGLISCISREAQDCLPRHGTAHSDLGPSTSTSNHENAQMMCPIGQHNGGISSSGWQNLTIEKLIIEPHRLVQQKTWFPVGGTDLGCADTASCRPTVRPAPSLG
jgi:hypothetical protein